MRLLFIFSLVRKPSDLSRLLRMLGIIGMVWAIAASAIAFAADSPPAEHRHHPRRRPGVRRHGFVRQRDQDAEPRLAGEGRRALHELLHPRELLAHAIHAAERRRYPPERPGQHGRVDRAQPARRGGYEGYLNNRVATLPQLLKDAGYHTYMVGKWHMGKAPDQIPAARGFERDFSLLDGGGSYWDMTNFTAASPKSVFTEDGRYLTQASRGLLRDEDLHRQADRIHRRQPWRRQALLRLRRPPGAARPVPPAEGLAQPACRRIRQGLGRGAPGAAEAADRDGHHAGRHRAC